MKRKIFISLDFPDKAKNRLANFSQKWQDLPVKWTRAQNLHLTLVYLGFVETEDIPQICEAAARAANQNNIFDVELDSIRLFPDATDPKMICLVGQNNDDLKNLVSSIENALDISRGPKKTFRPHITLGRLRKHKWEAQAVKPDIDEKFSLSISVETVAIMASDFDGKENEYSVIESCPLS
jgi:RNA 2',3'-cyclic 3'-phosphodiesterase